MVRSILAKVLPVVFALLLSGAAFAQTTYDSLNISVNAGNPSFATFSFVKQYAPDNTQLIIECGSFARAELQTNFDDYYFQTVSPFFAVDCFQPDPVNHPKQWELTNLPMTVTLQMPGSNAYYAGYTPNVPPRVVTLTINSASWIVNPCRQSRWGCGSGTAEIVCGAGSVCSF